MNKKVVTKKAGFIFRSLMWSFLLYAGITCFLNWDNLTGKEQDTSIVYSDSKSSLISPVRVSIDSFQKRIKIADIVLQYLQIPLRH